MSNPLRGKRIAWLRQFGDSAERTLPAILNTLRRIGGFDGLALKVADGVAWVGSYDPITPVTSVATLAALSAACWQAGIEFVPVVVPRGYTDRGEAELHAQIAAACGALIIDIEHGAGFWDQSPLPLVPAYFATLRSAAGPDAYLCAQPDPRPGATAVLPLAALAPFVDAFAAQHYVGFDAGWMDVALEAERVQAIRTLGRDTYVTLWGLGDLDAAGAFWERVRADALGFQVFAFGAMNADQLNWCAALPPPIVPTPTPPKPTNDDFIAMERLLLAEPPDLAGLIAYAERFV